MSVGGIGEDRVVCAGREVGSGSMFACAMSPLSARSSPSESNVIA